LYGGTLGILLFLAYLGYLTGKGRYTDLARKALASVLKRLDQSPASAPYESMVDGIGAFSGCGGIIYTLAHVAALWGDAALLSRAEHIIERTAARVEHDRSLDVIGGVAGLIPVLCGFYRVTGFRPALKVARNCADHLITLAHPMDSGIAWDTPVRSTRPLTGFSHGAAGFAWALHEIGALTGEPSYIKASMDAVAYERSVFSPEATNWPDFRGDGSVPPGAPESLRNGPTFSMTWCHGAPGIALARLISLGHGYDSALRTDAEIALEITLRCGFGMNHSLCHGDLGNLEPVLVASQVLGGSRWQNAVSTISSRILAGIKADGCICGVPQGVETPGLLVGLAGIGYGLLRLADPARVPSVLALAPPCGRYAL